MANENESLFLAFRRFFPIPEKDSLLVANEEEIIEAVRATFSSIDGRIGILLSSGIDSAILARFLPRGSIAYTLDYSSRYARRSEFNGASMFVPPGVNHRRIIIERDAYFAAIDELTVGRRAPTVPHEPAVYIASKQAREDGIDYLVGGFGADSRLGGFPALYRNSSAQSFRQQLFRSYIDPQRVLVEPASVDWVFDRYTVNDQVDVQRFLTEVGTEGSSAREAIALCGIVPVTPYTDLAFAGHFDQSQESKYLLSNVFTMLYGTPPPNRKFALWVPYGDWFGGIHITRPEFLSGWRIARPLFNDGSGPLRRVLQKAWGRFRSGRAGRRSISAKQGYLLYSLERYYHFKERNGWITPSPHGFA